MFFPVILAVKKTQINCKTNRFMPKEFRLNKAQILASWKP